MVDDSDSNPFRSVSDALGQFVRRVSTVVSEVSETVTLPDNLRKDLEAARRLRFAGDFAAAHEHLEEVLTVHPAQANALNSLAFVAIHELIIEGRTTESRTLLEALDQLKEDDGKGQSPPAGIVLLDAGRVLASSLHPMTSAASYSPHDALRRASRQRERLATFERSEFELLEHLLAARAHEASGAHERSVRELQKARSRLPLDAGAPLREWLLAHGAQTLLAEGRLPEAERWVRGLHRHRVDRQRAAAQARTDTPDSAEPEQVPPEPREAEPATGATATPGRGNDERATADSGARMDSRATGDQPTSTDSDRELGSTEEHLTASERAWMARVMAARGDKAAAKALLEGLPEEGEWLGQRLRVALALGEGTVARRLALTHLQLGPEDPLRLRLWALAELLPREEALGDRMQAALLEALMRACEIAPPALRAAHLHELALILLESNRLVGREAQRVVQTLESTDASPAMEARLVRARGRIAGDAEVGTIDQDFLAGPPRRFRGDPASSLVALGPDELSPLRDPRRRHVVITSHMRLAEAERALMGTPNAFERETAESALVEALMEDPQLSVARTMMAALAQPEPTPTLESLLAASTRLLARVPGQILGVSLEGAAEGLSQVVAARERLARPLTIAIMGEFSSGKSTFVNALLGQTVAPMGVLPTTSTINVFRHGSGRGARVHYRDGRISTVSGDELEPYLTNLDDQEANKIRYLEIDRKEGRMGNASVVDTPGLNALDPYHEKVAREFLDEADAVVWIFSATQGGTASEAGMLDELREGGRQVLGVLNKVDTLDGDERAELGAYLRKKLGNVLVDVVPLSATEALAHRTAEDGPSSGGKDPFAEVDRALETHFLRRARQLKIELTRRRLVEALSHARGSVVEAAKLLEDRGDAIDFDQALGDELAAMTRFADALESDILDLDDLLSRECLAMGVVVAGSGRRHDGDRQDFAYLDSLLEELTLGALRRAMHELGGQHDAILERIDGHLLPWARGYMRARAATGFGEQLIRNHGESAREGEAAFRNALRRGLRPIAEDWASEARTLAQGLELALVRARRQATSAPQAHALRMHTAWLAGLDQLIERAQAI
jgi:GTP-binding protein EngB required for normal cell division/tetratricopeptide (TPR) repeat protein